MQRLPRELDPRPGDSPGIGSGDECAWVSVADTIGLTSVFKRGAHNGWGRSVPGADLNDPVAFVSAHQGQAGTCWDLYSVRGSRDTLTGNAGSLGSRFAPRCSGCPSSGRESRQGPTSIMLRMYRVVVVLTGSRSVQLLGPLADRGQDDVALLQEFLVLPGGTAQPRGFWTMGSGFGESESAGHSAFLSQYLRASLRSGDYSFFSGNANPSVPITVPLPVPAKTYGLFPRSLDVFNVNTTAPAGQANAYYENVGAGAPYVASVYKPPFGGASPFITVLDGFDLHDLGSVGNTNTDGRKNYVRNTLDFQFGSVFFCPGPSGGVGPDELTSSFLSLANNPLTHGSATIRLTLPKSDRAKVAIYDAAGRWLKTLADGELTEGPHAFTWDGRDGRGSPVAPGVYWVKASTARGTRDVKTLVVLR